MTPTFDHIDADIRQHRLSAWKARSGPRVGDFVETHDGDMLRIAHVWEDAIQTTCSILRSDSSFYFGHGYMSHSGALNSAIPSEMFEDTGRIQDGSCWFFHHDHALAHNGVRTTIPCRVYRLRHTLTGARS